jgi:cytochrome c2
VEIEAIATYLFVTSKLREAIPPAGPAGDTAAGRALFASAGCIACHSTRERAVGDRFALGTFAPDLSRVGDKVSAGWLYGWLRAPRAYLAETKMPDLRLAEMEAANLTAFLMQTMRGGGQPAQPGTFPEEAFDVLLAEQGPGAPERKPAAAVQAVFDALPDKARVTKAFAAGERLIQHYGCFACHTIQGLADAPLPCPDLTGVADKGPDKFAFGRTLSDASLRHTTWDWLRMKVSRPRVFDVGKLDTLKPNERLRMPWFGYQGPGAERNPDGPSPAGLSAAEADALVTHLLSLTNERVRESIQHAAGPRETADDRGWRALRERNCAACHLPRVVGTAGALPVETLLQWEAEHRANLSDPVEPDAAVQGLRAVHPSLFGVGRQ